MLPLIKRCANICVGATSSKIPHMAFGEITPRVKTRHLWHVFKVHLKNVFTEKILCIQGFAHTFCIKLFRQSKINGTCELPRSQKCCSLGCALKTKISLKFQRENFNLHWNFQRVIFSFSLTCGCVKIQNEKMLQKWANICYVFCCRFYPDFLTFLADFLHFASFWGWNFQCKFQESETFTFHFFFGRERV